MRRKPNAVFELSGIIHHAAASPDAKVFKYIFPSEAEFVTLFERRGPIICSRVPAVWREIVSTYHLYEAPDAIPVQSGHPFEISDA